MWVLCLQGMGPGAASCPATHLSRDEQGDDGTFSDNGERHSPQLRATTGNQDEPRPPRHRMRHLLSCQEHGLCGHCDTARGAQRI